MLSYSNFGSDKGSPASVHEVVSTFIAIIREMVVDGEMQVTFCFKQRVTRRKYPFTKLAGKDVNTLIFLT